MNVFKRIFHLLREGKSCVQATILSRSGSAPRAVGTRMVICSDGSLIGTIGGGILEARVQRLAEEVFKTKEVMIQRFVLTTEDASRTGMICGGEVQVLIHFVDASQLRLYGELTALLETRKKAWLMTLVPAESGSSETPAQYLVGHDGSVVGTSEHERVKDLPAPSGRSEPETVESPQGRFLVEPLGNRSTVYIFGAGHVSQSLVPLAAQVGFRTVVLDDREAFANRQRFDTADDILVVDSFDQAVEGLEIDEDCYLVLVTRGHAHDKTVLEQALKTRAGYIGMIGSKRKRDGIYHLLRKEGFTDHDLERVHSPIGLDIGAETPEEIAVSIAAELIRARAGRNQ